VRFPVQNDLVNIPVFSISEIARLTDLEFNPVRSAMVSTDG